MEVLVVTEHRFDRTADGAIWTQAMFSEQFWHRYLEVFQNVNVVARVRNVDQVPEDWKRADGPRISFVPIPHYVGPWQFLKSFRSVQRAIRASVTSDAAVVLRVPSQLATMMMPELTESDHP